MVIFLLIIIAIGVLLASQAGQELLSLFLILLFIGGICFVGFWAIIFFIAIFSDKGVMDAFDNVVGVIGLFVGGVVLICWLCYSVYKTYKRFKSGEYSIKKMGLWFKHLPMNLWKKHPRVVCLYVIVVVLVTWAMIANR
jgi:hypothetical protein